MSKRMIDTLIHSPLQEMTQSNPGLQDKLQKAEVLVIDTVVKYFFQENEKSFWDLSDFPNCAPPFPIFWMEHRAPQYIRKPGTVVPWTGPYACGCLFIATPLSSLTATQSQCLSKTFGTADEFSRADAKWLLTATPLAQSSANPDSLRYFDLHVEVLIGASGQMLPLNDGGPKACWHVADNAQRLFKDNEDRDRILSALLVTLEPFWLAISFLHCKNVTMAPVDPCHPKGKKKPSMACPRMHYHVLDIHPMREILRREGKQESTGLKQALHICRGHFSDYSKGKGLFGKHKGLYWFDQHLRGASQHGVVVKDYAIHPK